MARSEPRKAFYWIGLYLLATSLYLSIRPNIVNRLFDLPIYDLYFSIQQSKILLFLGGWMMLMERYDRWLVRQKVPETCSTNLHFWGSVVSLVWMVLSILYAIDTNPGQFYYSYSTINSPEIEDSWFKIHEWIPIGMVLFGLSQLIGLVPLLKHLLRKSS